MKWCEPLDPYMNPAITHEPLTKILIGRHFACSFLYLSGDRSGLVEGLPIIL